MVSIRYRSAERAFSCLKVIPAAAVQSTNVTGTASSVAAEEDRHSLAPAAANMINAVHTRHRIRDVFYCGRQNCEKLPRYVKCLSRIGLATLLLVVACRTAALPPLPDISTASFSPAVREAVQAALDEA